MIEQAFVVGNRMGLHARPASMFVQAGSKFRCDIKVSKGVGDEKIVVNGKSVMGLMMLAVASGESIRIVLNGPDEKEALAVFKKLFAEKFNEE